MLLPLGDSEAQGPRTSNTLDLPQVVHLDYIQDCNRTIIIKNKPCRKGKSHIKSKGENQLAADDFEALFETSK